LIVFLLIDADGVEVVRRSSVVPVRVQPLLSAAASTAVHHASPPVRAHGHRAQSPLSQVRLHQQDVLRIQRSADAGRRHAPVQAPTPAGR